MDALQDAKSATTFPKPALVFHSIPGTVWVWLGLISIWILGKFALGLMPAINVPLVAGEFAWKNIAALGLLGLLGAWLSSRTGFPDALAANISNRQRLFLPLLLGMGIALLEVGVELITHGTRLLAADLGGQFNVNFPASLIVYPSGVPMIEAYYRLFPLPFLLFVISNLILRKRGQAATFWVLAIILSLLEPLSQMGSVALSQSSRLPAGWEAMVIPAAVLTYALNLSQAFAFRRYGLLASVAIRLGEYLIWHIAFWNFIAPALFH